jgi:twitching motility protein PilT
MLPGIIQTGKKTGMVLMDDSVAELYSQGIITTQEAVYRAENKPQMRTLCGV